MRITINDKKLSNYFRDKAAENNQIPYLPKISEETGISTATISRFAKRKGYYNFSEMRAKFNKSIEHNEFTDQGLGKFLKHIKKHTLYLISSKSTRILSLHIKLRLELIGINAVILKNDITLSAQFDLIQKGDRVMFFSISGDTNSFHKWTKTKKINETIFISTKKSTAENDHTNYIILKEYKPVTYSKLDVSESVKNIFLWLDQIINIFQIENARKY